MQTRNPHYRKESKAAERVRSIQKGGPIPKSAVAKVISRRNQDVTKKFQERKAIRDEYRKFRDRLMAKYSATFPRDSDVLPGRRPWWNLWIWRDCRWNCLRRRGYWGFLPTCLQHARRTLPSIHALLF
jgi:hypothetical protein